MTNTMLVLPKGTITDRGLSLPSSLSFEEWQHVGRQLQRMERSVMWWIGDWLNFGELKYGERYAQAIEEFQYAYQTLRNAKFVAGEIEMSRRRDNLSWSHHSEIVGLEPKEQEKWLKRAEDEHWTQKELRTALRRAYAKEPPPLPSGMYDVILADPPWKYDFAPATNIEIEDHYPTLSVEELSVLQVPSAKDAVLFLWATNPKLKEAMQVMEAWGFTYKTNMCWDKEKPTHGKMGYWFFGQHELLLIGTKGVFPPPAEEKRISSVYRERKGGHSVKPEFFYEMIETMFPKRTYLELFARKRYGTHWTSWGNDLL